MLLGASPSKIAVVIAEGAYTNTKDVRLSPSNLGKSPDNSVISRAFYARDFTRLNRVEVTRRQIARWRSEAGLLQVSLGNVAGQSMA